ncbi:MAG: integrase, partial [Gammaproteobacteria bacterium]|nr:integrase [Gammaproteobacteria bacterium]
ALSPTLKVIPEKLQELEGKIKRAVESGRDVVTNIAQQEYAASRQTVAELQRQLDEHKRRATEFSARFSEHEAQKEDLISPEELYRGVEGRLVQIETENRQKYGQVKVVEWAFPPKDPINPLYLRGAVIVLAGSILAALFVVLLMDFLTPREKSDATTTLAGVALYPAVAPNALPHSAQLDELESTRTPVLEHQQQEHLLARDLDLFMQGADPAARSIVVLLLHGLSLEEILMMEPNDID